MGTGAVSSLPMDSRPVEQVRESLVARIEGCRACPRLVAWREQVANEKRASFRHEDYWGRPVAGFGDPSAVIAVVGLAPAAHGANRTGRIFTGDRSGDWLFASMHRVGLANQALSVSRDDGLELKGVFVTAAVRCAPPANKPNPDERDRCLPYLVEELDLLPGLAVVMALGQFAYQVVARLYGVSPRPRFGHGAEVATGAGPTIVCSFHPSQQNTFTCRLTEAMTDAVFARAAELAGV
jgi:uracil-DNA glycosylase